MGLDQYAYVASQAGQGDLYWDEYDLPEDQKTVTKPREIAYWRKHPNLQGWMRDLWESKVNQVTAERTTFNGVELELTWEDLEKLEADIKTGQLPHTTGFFFGDPSDDYYREQDLKFIKDAKAELFVGLRVFYNSSW
jgi:hypothetical protein